MAATHALPIHLDDELVAPIGPPFSSLPPPPLPHVSIAPVTRRRRPSARRSVKQDDADSATKKPRKKKTGWGPYGTVINERAVAFNLTLDVQQLKQEIQSLTVARNILVTTRALSQRHDPNGSLMRSVEAYYDMIRTGITLEQPVVGGKRPRRALHSQNEQRAFVDTFVDPDIDFGDGLVGPSVMFEQLQRYSVFLKFICLELQSFEIMNADDTVVITTIGNMHFQILRSTIAGVFPHVMGEEWLVSKLVGRDVYTTVGLGFYFNKSDRVCKYTVDLDFCAAFAGLLSDPSEVDILFGRALIGDNCMLETPIAAVALDGDAPAPEQQQQLALYRPSHAVPPVGEYETLPVPHQLHALSPLRTHVHSPASSSSQTSEQCTDHDSEHSSRREHYKELDEAPQPLPATDDLSAIVWQYFEVFSRTDCLRTNDALSPEQRAFVDAWVSPICEFGDAVDDAGAAVAVGRHALHERWRALACGFELLGFVETSQDPLVQQPQENLSFVRATAEYALRITNQTLASVFPHVAADALLRDALLDVVLSVKTQLKFWLESDSGQIACVKEVMDFQRALAPLVPHPDDLAWVLARARLTTDGVQADVLHATCAERARRSQREVRTSAAADRDRAVADESLSYTISI